MTKENEQEVKIDVDMIIPEIEQGAVEETITSFAEARDALPLVSNSVLFNKVGSDTSNFSVNSSKRKKRIKSERIRFDYKDVKLLTQYLAEAGGRIPPARMTKLSRSEHREFARAVKKARQMMLIPYRYAIEA